MRIQLHIETYDPGLGFDMMETKSLGADTAIEAPGGATVEYEGSLVRRGGVGAPEVLQFIVDASVTVNLSLLSAWLYDKVKSRKVGKIKINRREVTEVSPDGIRKVLEEEITIEK